MGNQKGTWGPEENEVKTTLQLGVLGYRGAANPPSTASRQTSDKPSARKWGSGLLSRSGAPRSGWARLWAAERLKRDVETVETRLGERKQKL